MECVCLCGLKVGRTVPERNEDRMAARRFRKWILSLTLLAACAFGAGCGSSGTAMGNVQTVHNEEATRIWLIHTQHSGSASYESVVVCDIERAAQSLCISWEK